MACLKSITSNNFREYHTNSQVQDHEIIMVSIDGRLLAGITTFNSLVKKFCPKFLSERTARSFNTITCIRAVMNEYPDQYVIIECQYSASAGLKSAASAFNKTAKRMWRDTEAALDALEALESIQKALDARHRAAVALMEADENVSVALGEALP